MLDRDLAVLYGVETRVLNQAVKRNKERFPDDFMFQLTKMEAEYLEKEEKEASRSQFVTSKSGVLSSKQVLISQIVTSKKETRGGIQKNPYVFTEQGVAMLSSVLKSKRAIEMNIAIMRAFVKIRNLIYSYKDLAEKIEKIEKKYDKQIGRIFEVLDGLVKEDKKAKSEIGFRGVDGPDFEVIVKEN